MIRKQEKRRKKASLGEKLKNKILMKIERIISYFDKKTEKLIGEYNVDHISLEVLKEIIKNRKNDPLMYEAYGINKNQAQRLSQYIDLKFDFNHYIYELDCFQVSYPEKN
jgi:hypothetical protein